MIGDSRQVQRFKLVLSLTLTICMVLLCTGALHAQDVDDGPVLFREHKEYDKFSVYNLQSYAELMYRYNHDESNSASGSTEVTEHRMEETINLSADSYLIHPNLLLMHFGGSFGFSQDTVDSNSSSQTSNGFVQNYNISATLLRKEFMPVTAFATRSTSQVSNQFSGTQENTTNTYGMNVLFKSKKIPSQFHYEHTNLTQNSALGTNNFSTDQDTFTWHSSMHPTENQNLNFDYTFNRFTQNNANAASNSSQSQNVAVTHNLLFGENNKYSLTSSANYSQTSGAFEFTTLSFNESLDMQLSPNLRSSIRYNYNESQRPSYDQSSHRAEASLTHKLYKSLTTDVRGGIVQTENVGQYTTFEKYGNINLNYRKTVPYGVLGITATARYNQTDTNTLNSSNNTVFGEGYTYTAPNDIFINHRNIVVGSIRVYNASLQEYFEGTDYTLTYNSEYVQLSVPLVGSNINDGQALLIDYSTSSDPTNTTTTIGEGVGIYYSIQEGWFRGLRLYANFYTQHQNVEGNNTSSITPDESTDISYGVDYSVGALFLRAQITDHDSNTSPYKTTDLSASYAYRMSSATAFSLSSSYRTTEYFNQDNTTTTWRVSGKVNQKLGMNLYGSLTATYQSTSNTNGGDQTGFTQSATLNWTHRQTSIYLTGNNSFTNTASQDTMSQSLEIGIRRTF